MRSESAVDVVGIFAALGHLMGVCLGACAAA
jgi:hypothetical protein